MARLYATVYELHHIAALRAMVCALLAHKAAMQINSEFLWQGLLWGKAQPARLRRQLRWLCGPPTLSVWPVRQAGAAGQEKH